MSWLFGKKKKPTTQTPQQRSEEITKTIEDLNKKCEYYDKQIQQQTKMAIMYKNKGQKQKALECMKRKKALEAQQSKISQMSFNLEQQRDQIQNAAISADVFNNYRKNNETIKQQFGNLDADKIEDIIDEMEDTQAEMDTITDALTRPMGPQLDEDELNDELDALGEEIPDEGEAEAQQPVHAQAEAEDDDAELAQLMGSFA